MKSLTLTESLLLYYSAVLSIFFFDICSVYLTGQSKEI